MANSTVSGDSFVGGICGSINEDNISSCYVTSSTVSGNVYVGGICGVSNSNKSSISSCYVTSSTASGTSNVGGICGEIFEGNISSCYVANSRVFGTKSVGGICGDGLFYNVTSCFVYLESLDDITEPSSSTGLIVGEMGHLYDCFVNLSGDLCGEGTTLENCYDGVSAFDDFKAKTWSDSFDYTVPTSFDEANSVWNAFDFSQWPPTLKTEN